MTLGYMQRMALDGSKDLEVRSAAIEALDRYGAPAHAPVAALGAIHRYIQDQIRFVPDPVGAQMVQSPRATLEFRAGNCAQRATLLAAMARSVGIPADIRFRVAALNPRAPRSFSHVYVVANAGGREIPLDPTYPGMPPGAEPPNPTRVGDFPVYQTMNGCRAPGCYGVIDPTLGWNPLKALGSVVKKAVLPAAMFATKFLPGGAIVSTAAKLALSTAGSGGARSTGPALARFGSVRQDIRARVLASRPTVAVAQASPLLMASMSSAGPAATAQPVAESQAAQAAASEATPEAAAAAASAGGGSMLPLLLLGGAALLLLRPKRRS